MKINTSRISSHTQSQRQAARVLFILWLLASCSLEYAPADPERQGSGTTNSHFVERIATTEQLSVILADKGVCVLHGFGGVGKSTLAALYGHERKDTQTVCWIDAEDNFKLQEEYEQLAQELQVAYQPLAKNLATAPSQYRQELASLVNQALEKISQSTLLILDNAENASLVADYLLHRPDAIQVIITTRSAEAFEGKYEQLQLGPFSQDEGESYLEVCFKEMNRPYTNPEIASLLKEVGLVAQKLNLAAGYLQARQQATTAQYIARLQDLKRANISQPEVALNLEQLPKEGQQLMQYVAYLDGTFIPLSLVNILSAKEYPEQHNRIVSNLSLILDQLENLFLGEEDPDQLSEVVLDLWRLSLVEVVSNNKDQELGLRVHREVQAFCREYKDWSAGAALGTDTILSKLAEVLKSQMPWVDSTPDDSWQQAKLYAPHVEKVITALNDSEAGAHQPDIAATLNDWGVAFIASENYRRAQSYLERALAIYEQVHQETPNQPDIASTLSNLGVVWLALDDARQAVSFLERALAIYQQVYHETPKHPKIASTLNNLGNAWYALGDGHKAVSFYERVLAIYEQAYQETPNHPDSASTLNNLGNAWLALGDVRQAVSFYERALAIYEQVYKETPKHPEIAKTLNNLGIAWSDLRDARQAVSYYQRALAIYEQVYQEAPNQPDIAATLNNLGTAWSDLRDARQAVSFYDRALAIYAQVYQEAPNQPDIAATLNNLGNAWLALGDVRQAVSFYDRALAIYEQVYHETPNHPDIARTLNNLGTAWYALGDVRQAVSFYERVLAIYEQVYHETPNHPDIASTLNNLGNAWSALGDARKAVSFLERALAIYQQVYKETPNHPDIAKALNNLGDVHCASGHPEEALTYYFKAFRKVSGNP